MLSARLDDASLRAVAEALVRRESASPVGPGDAARAEPEALARWLERDLCEDAPPGLLDAPKLAEVGAALRRFVDDHPDRFRERVRRGRVGRIHGDLHLAQLRAAPDGGIAIEAPADGGRTGDFCVDAAGLCLDLTLTGRSDLAERLLAVYAEAAGDFDLYRVVDFYERERARARALLHARRAMADEARAVEAEREAGSARRSLVLALATARRPLLPPAVVATAGLVASGKSTLAAALAARMGTPRIVADRERRDLLERPGASAALAFAPHFDAAVYAALIADAEAVLESGRGVVLDACFPTRSSRATARDLARRRGVPFLLVECRCDPAIVRRRLAERDRPGRAGDWLALYEGVAVRFESVDELGGYEHVVVDGNRPVEEALARLEARLPLWPARGEPR